MAIDFNTVSSRIRQAGPNAVRCTPMPGQHVDTGEYQIEIMEDGAWRALVTGLPRETATSVVSRAAGRVLFG